MQLIQSKSNFIEKILRDKEGRLVRATFAVYENGGRIKARLVDFVYLTNKVLNTVIFALTAFSEKISKRIQIYFKQQTLSPVYISEILNKTGSKPRAPTIL